MSTDNDQYKSYMEDYVVGTNKYRCLFRDCEVIVDAPSWKQNDGMCRQHRGASTGQSNWGFAPASQLTRQGGLRGDRS